MGFEENSSSTAWSDGASTKTETFPDYMRAGTKTYAGAVHGGRGLVTFSSGHTNAAWHEHPSVFTRESPMFEQLFAYNSSRKAESDPCKEVASLERLSSYPTLHFKLVGVSNKAFEAFLKALRPRLENEFNLQELKDVLILSTQWEFENPRDYAIRHIPKHTMKPLDKIELARTVNLREWLMEPFIELSRRLAPLTLGETTRLGLSTATAVFSAREAVLRRRIHHTSGVRPDTLFGYGTWRHPHCWTLLCTAWDLILTNNTYRMLDPPESAFVKALKDLERVSSLPKAEGLLEAECLGWDSKVVPGKLCYWCNIENQLVEWTQPQLEKDVAEQTLKVALPQDQPVVQAPAPRPDARGRTYSWLKALEASAPSPPVIPTNRPAQPETQSPWSNSDLGQTRKPTKTRQRKAAK